MDRDPHDAPFRTWFRELRSDDARHTPPAHRLLDAAVTRKDRLRRQGALPATVAAMTIAALLVIVFWTTPFAPRGTPTAELWQWQPPTAQLLHSFGEELLSKTPQLGAPLTMSTEGTRD